MSEHAESENVNSGPATTQARLEGLIRDPDQDLVTVEVLAQNAGTKMDGPPLYRIRVEGALTTRTRRHPTLDGALTEAELLGADRAWGRTE